MNLIPTCKLSLELTKVLTDIEIAGIKINIETLQRIKKDFTKEYTDLEQSLNELGKRVMGDTTFNLNSSEDRSVIIYSRKVKDKKFWKQFFNLGFELRGNTRKAKRRIHLKQEEFERAVRSMTRVQARTIAHKCKKCNGVGKVAKLRKDNTFGKVRYKCHNCNAVGIVYKPTSEVAGLKLAPKSIFDVSVNGFKTDSTTLQELLTVATGVARMFIEKYIRYSSLRTYLTTFVEGIEKAVNEQNFIHPQFMQCVTSTGRLSSRSPNFQNMPRGVTFPVRKAIVSRFENGLILEGDYSQLEFRVAGFLSKDKQVYKDAKNNVDVHDYTAKVMGVTRQQAKAHTFKPLYGGVLGTPKQKEYYLKFRLKYEGIANWHKELQEEAIIYKRLQLPSGRVYKFPYVERTRYGTATHSTSIKNYPVQGFATADLLPIALVKTHKSMKTAGLKSMIINTVHDSIVIDVHPNERTACVVALQQGMYSIALECERRYNIKYDMPIDIELKIGKDWLNLQETS